MTNPLPHILFFIPSLSQFGGAEVSSMRLVGILQKYYKISYFTLHPSDIVIQDHYCLGQSESFISKMLQMIPNAWRLARYCKKNNIQIVVAHLPRPNTITMLAKVFFKLQTKNYLVVHSANHNGILNILAMRFLWGQASKIVCVSHMIEKKLNTMGLLNTETIYNPIDIQNIHTLSKHTLPMNDEYLFTNENLICVTVGRLVEAKGHIYLIHAIAKAITSIPTLRLIIIGEGEMRRNLEAEIQKLELEDHVFLIGRRENIFPYLLRSHIFLLSSLWEGLPTVLLEALVCGLPVIATDCLSGPREILAPEVPLGGKYSLSYPHIGSRGVLITVPSLHKFTEYSQNLSDMLVFAHTNSMFLQRREYALKEYLPENTLEKWNVLLKTT